MEWTERTTGSRSTIHKHPPPRPAPTVRSHPHTESGTSGPRLLVLGSNDARATTARANRANTARANTRGVARTGPRAGVSKHCKCKCRGQSVG